MLVFAYELIRGTASNGQMSGDNLYPSPTLQVFPGETLIVHLDNALTGLTIRDFFDPQYTAKGEEVPLYPPMMTSSPLNLHVHGVHVSPKGNADNVMLHIPGGVSNTYTYNIPKTMPQGAYWYHSHLHGLTTPHVYYGMAGLLAIGRTDGNLAAGHAEPDPDPQHGAAIQLRVRPGGRERATQQLFLAAMGQHDQAAGRRRAGEGHVPSAARPGQLPAIEAGHAKLHRLVRGCRCRSATSVGGSSSSRAICSASPPSPAAPARTCRPTPACPTISATCSSPSTVSSSR